MRVVPFSALVLLVLAVPAAVAQEQASSLTINGVPAEIADLDSNVTKDIPFTVEYMIEGTVCPPPPPGQTATISVTVTPKATASFVTVSLDPATADVTFPMGAANPARQSASFTLKVAVTEVTANASIPIEIKASASVPACVPATPAPAEAMATTYANLTAPPPPPPPPPPVEESPGPGALMGIVAAAAAAAVLRRKA